MDVTEPTLLQWHGAECFLARFALLALAVAAALAAAKWACAAWEALYRFIVLFRW